MYNEKSINITFVYVYACRVFQKYGSTVYLSIDKKVIILKNLNKESLQISFMENTVLKFSIEFRVHFL